MEHAELGRRFLADGAGEPQGQLGTRPAAHRNQHTPDRRGIGPDEGHVTGRIDQQVLDGIDPKAVVASAVTGARFQNQQVGIGLEHRLTNALGRNVRDAHLPEQLAGTALRVSGDARQERAIRTRHLDAFAQRALGCHLDDPEERAARIFSIEEWRNGLEQWAGASRIRRGNQYPIVAHGFASSGSIRSLIRRSQESASRTCRRRRATGASIACWTARVNPAEPLASGTTVAPCGASSLKAGRSVQTTGVRKMAASASGNPKPSLALGKTTTSLSI